MFVSQNAPPLHVNRVAARAGQNAPVPAAVGDFNDDDVLVAALRRGDEDAFGWLLDHYSSPLLRLARTYVSNPEAAHEVVQETWVAVITGVDGFEQRSSLKTWIYRILMNVARSKGVKERRSLPFTSLAAELEADEHSVDQDRFRGPRERWPGHWANPPVPWDEAPEDRVLIRETVSVISTAISLLPSNQQTVITLRDLEGWAADEVCNALEVSETNQRVLLHRARSKVRRALEVHFEEAAG
jgi:RNA polymerase sigma-70 factor (ECF subfamily)